MPPRPPPRAAHGEKSRADKRRPALEDGSRFLFDAEQAAEPIGEVDGVDRATAGGPQNASPLPGQREHAQPRKSDVRLAKPHYHDHRARLRERFSAQGPEALADYEILELVLFRIVPRRDTKPLAKALLTRFGDLAGVLGADPARIAEVPGAGPQIALEIAATHALMTRASRSEIRRRPVISSWAQLLQYCRMSMAQSAREQFRVLFLDVKNNLISDEVLGEGTIDHAPVYPREVARRALEHGASAAILVHNHPSGDPRPSAADIAITREVVAAAKAVGVVVHDHIVVGRDGVASLKNMQLM